MNSKVVECNNITEIEILIIIIAEKYDTYLYVFFVLLYYLAWKNNDRFFLTFYAYRRLKSCVKFSQK